MTPSMSPTAPSTDSLSRWRRFADAVGGDSIDVVATEDVVAAFVDRSLLQEDVDQGRHLSPEELVELDRADRAFKDAAPALLDRTQISLFKDDEPVSHWWWHIEELVLGRSSSLLLSVPEAASLKEVHPHTIRAAVKSGQVPARRLARGFLIHRRDLERWEPRSVGRPRGTRGSDPLLEAFNEANTQGDLDRAAQVAKAIARDPSTSRRCLALALDGYNREQPDEALHWAVRAQEGDLPSDSRQTALLVEGRAHLLLGHPGRAKRVLTAARGLGSIDALVQAALADAELALGHPKRAVEEARRAVEIAPGVIEMRFVLARMEWHDDRVWDALEHIIEFRAQRPEDPQGVLLHCALLGFIGDRAGDPSCYERVLAILRQSPSADVDAYQAYGVASARSGRQSDAIRSIRQLVRLEHVRDQALHAAHHVAAAVVQALSYEDPVKVIATLDSVDGLVGSTALTRSARALVHAVAGDVEATYSALGYKPGELEAAAPEMQQIIAMALVNGGRATEAHPILQTVIDKAQDQNMVQMAIRGALFIDDLQGVRLGLQRMAEGAAPDDWASLSLAILDSAQRHGRAEAVTQGFTWMTAPAEVVSARDPRPGDRPSESHWEGVHHATSPILDDLARSMLH